VVNVGLYIINGDLVDKSSTSLFLFVVNFEVTGVIKLRVGIHILHCFSHDLLNVLVLVREDLDVNENERLSNITLRHKLK